MVNCHQISVVRVWSGQQLKWSRLLNTSLHPDKNQCAKHLIVAILAFVSHTAPFHILSGVIVSFIETLDMKITAGSSSAVHPDPF